MGYPQHESLWKNIMGEYTTKIYFLSQLDGEIQPAAV